MNLQRWQNVGAAVFASAILLSASHANATTLTFSLNQTGSGPIGTAGSVVLDDSEGAEIVDVLVTLNDGYGFVSTGAGSALSFNLAGSPVITIDDITTGFAMGGANNASPFGNFGYTVVCTVPTGCGNGGSVPNPGPLTFDVHVSGITLDSFIGNGDPKHPDVPGYFFAADVIGPTAAGGLTTGNVGALGPQTLRTCRRYPNRRR